MKITFYGNLPELLRRNYKGQKTIEHDLNRKTSVKDVIESFGVPHTEISQIKIKTKNVSFSHQVEDGDIIEAHSHKPPVDVLSPTLLRPKPLAALSFSVDINVAKLAPLLRMAGFDTYYKNYISDSDLVTISCKEKRILLSKDKGILKLKTVDFGHLVRELYPENQLREIVHFFGLKEKMKPFSRCLLCNGELQEIEKEKIIEELEPLTKKYYNYFHRCHSCKKIYWAGSHKEKMVRLLQNSCGYSL